MSTEVFTSMTGDQLGHLALIEAIRANTDAVQRLARHGETVDHKLDDINRALGRIDTRLAVVEQSSISIQVEEHKRELREFEDRLRRLEDEAQQRKGAMGLFEWIGRNWPALLGFIALVMLLVTKWKWI